MKEESFKTPKGTELPLMNLKGKRYLQVCYRIVWVREEHPDWGIETEVLATNEQCSTVKAIIKNEQGRIIATAHQTEHMKDFRDHLAKSETAAIGRALALVGYGTQFAPEFDEEHRIVDSPLERAKVKHAYQIPEPKPENIAHAMVPNLPEPPAYLREAFTDEELKPADEFDGNPVFNRFEEVHKRVEVRKAENGTKSGPGSYTMPWGTDKGKTFDLLGPRSIRKTLTWARQQEKPGHAMKQFIKEAEEFLLVHSG